jgi:hypothetical protein
MSRSEREAKLRALAGPKYGAVVISEMGGPKKDRKKELNDQIGEYIRGSYEKGTLDKEVPAYARSLTMESSAKGVPAWAHRKVMNALPTLAGLGLGLSRGATFGPGPGDSIVAEYPDESGSVDPQTLGEVMLLPRGRTGEAVPTHELGHVAQGKYFGPLLPAAAAGTAGALSLMGRDPYLDSPFETSALEMGQAEEAGEPTSPAMTKAMLRAFRGR